MPHVSYCFVYNTSNAIAIGRFITVTVMLVLNSYIWGSSIGWKMNHCILLYTFLTYENNPWRIGSTYAVSNFV